ncbi:hypothetical protein U1Q18_028666, partial [Sarracenia purpurea var. burkii]
PLGVLWGFVSGSLSDIGILSMCLLSCIGLGLAVGPGRLAFGFRCSAPAWCPSANLVLVAGFLWLVGFWSMVGLGCGYLLDAKWWFFMGCS